MRYWWVNHKQTSKHEIKGGFLWSPMTKSNGASNRFYDNMRVAVPGDAIVSFSHAQIKYVGVVTDFAIPAPKPDSFGSTGDYWGASGWLLPVNWSELDTPVTPKAKISEISEFLPAKYFPIHKETGNGMQGVYLAEISLNLFEKIISLANHKKKLPDYRATSTPDELARIDESIVQQVLSDQTLDSTVKASVVAARIGQGVFKERIYQFEQSCRLTGVVTPALLVASHIKPWRLCVSASERLDGANGLLLAPHVDVLFDRGFISFSDEGDIMLSTQLNQNELDRLGLTEICEKGCGPFSLRQSEYLSFHRNNVFLK
jgi:putative restriction endonuclease